MSTIRVVLTIVYCIICAALVLLVLLQEGKSAGLTGSINGVADTYWGKNKGRSMEGALKKITAFLAVLFVIISVLLCMQW